MSTIDSGPAEASTIRTDRECLWTLRHLLTKRALDVCALNTLEARRN